MSRKIVGIALLSAVMLTAAGGLLLVTQEDAAAQSIRIGAYRPRFIVVFLDETGSRGEVWDAMRDQAGVIASRLKNREAFTVIGIDDHGFDEKDVRLPLTIVETPNDPSGLNVAALNQQRQAIMQQLAKLKRRGNPQSTDIVGAIRQAMDMAKKESKDRRVVLAFFSDMQQTPRMPDAAAFGGIQFPSGTEAYCFYVAASQSYDFPRTVDLWQRLLTTAGIKIAATDFHQQGTVAVGVNAAFPQ
jgi:hypothetical protein